MRRLLVFSYHFPPSSEVAGKPTARLVRRLPEHDWHATVLIPPTWSLFQLDRTAYADIERYARVEQTGIWLDPFYHRALARVSRYRAANGSNAPATWSAMDEQDARRGRSTARVWVSRCLAPVKTMIGDLCSWPDDHAGWAVPAYRYAVRLLRRERFDAVLSVCPSVSAHVSALLLRRRFPDLVWFAQYHDPWGLIPSPCRQRHIPGLDRLDRVLESAVVRRCDRIVCATDEASKLFAEAYGVGSRCCTLHNSFDPEDFPAPSEVKRTDHRLTFTYTGCLYGQRDPKPFFDSLSRLIRAGRLRADRVRVCLVGDCERAQDRSVRRLVQELGLEYVVELIPPVPYAEALGRLAQSDVLLLLAEGQPAQIPAKLYEYLHVRRPILAFCTGATARVVREAPSGQVVTSDRPGLIDAAILSYATEQASGTVACTASTDQIDRYRADVLASSLARELESALAERRSPRVPHARHSVDGSAGVPSNKELSSAGLRD
jgi:glycosyltransferase involved in cell wall biosynthesis